MQQYGVDMKLAITADVHLSKKGKHPERYSALTDILAQLKKDKINTLIIAGDLFDSGYQDYSNFEELCKAYKKIKIHIIPGNHDPSISSKVIVADNINIYTSVAAVEFDGVHFIFVPYMEKTGMGENLAGFESSISRIRWVLIGHGDFFGGLKEHNSYEAGTYMPLYRKDLDRLNPWKVFLGHIHKPSNYKNLYYPGSPCGLDINETGARQYLIFETSSGIVTPRSVNTEVIYFQEKFVIIPGTDEISTLRAKVESSIKSWNLAKKDKGKARIRISAAGYSSDRDAVLNTLREAFTGYTFFKDEEPDISTLSYAGDRRRSAIAEKTTRMIEELEWNFGGDEPELDRVIEAALSVIYSDGAS